MKYRIRLNIIEFFSEIFKQKESQYFLPFTFLTAVLFIRNFFIDEREKAPFIFIFALLILGFIPMFLIIREAVLVARIFRNFKITEGIRADIWIEQNSKSNDMIYYGSKSVYTYFVLSEQFFIDSHDKKNPDLQKRDLIAYSLRDPNKAVLISHMSKRIRKKINRMLNSER